MAEKLKEHFATDDIDAAMGNFMLWLGMDKEWQGLPGDSAIRAAYIDSSAEELPSSTMYLFLTSWP